jgi:hypothetical protein
MEAEVEMPELVESIPYPPNYFGENSYVRRPYEEDDSVQRANPAYLGKDPDTGADLYKTSMLPFIGTSGRVWGGDPDDDDTANDFAELEVAIAKFGEDFPGSIAPKIPKPPDEYDEQQEEIVWRNFKKEEVSVLEEDEEWKELKAALDEFGAAGMYPYMSQSDLQAVCDEYDVEMPTSGGHRIREPTFHPPKIIRSTADESMEFFMNHTSLYGPDYALLPQHMPRVATESIPSPPVLVRMSDSQPKIDGY